MQAINNPPAFPQDLQGRRGDDPEYQGMTLRQYAAIKLKVPDSGTDWLDEMITESLLNEFAARAISQVIAQCANDSMGWMKATDYFASRAHEMADAMLAEMLAERSNP